MVRYLKAFTIVATREIEVMRSILFDIYGARSFEPIGEQSLFFAEAAALYLDSSNLCYCSCGSAVRMEFHDDDYVRLQICLSGAGRTSTGQRRVDVNSTVIVCSPAEAVLEFGQSFEHLVLRAKQSALEKDLTILLGSKPKNRISFDLSASGQVGQSGRLRQFIIQAASIIDFSDEPIPSVILREMDQAIRLAVLYGIPNSVSSHLYADPKTSAPWQVKRIEEWIDANWKEDVTIEKLMDISGASARSIFATFRSARGYTPMAHLKKVRLKAAREILLRAAPGASVTGIAFACNFMNPGHFARDYKLEFGELPSETLRRRKELGL